MRTREQESREQESDYHLKAALQYAEWGWPVFPVHSPEGEGCSCRKPDCSSAGKHPRTRRGVKDATTEKAIITSWWEAMPEANIGIATGRPLVVLDIDPKHGGRESLQVLEKRYGQLPQTRTVHTGGGGEHYYFHTVEDLPNRVGLSGLSGIDIRGKGGYIIAPPSLHQSGQVYSWRPRPISLAEAPEWLSALLRPREEEAVFVSQLLARAQAQGDTLPEDYWLQRISQQAAPGNRNQLGFILACRLRDAGLSFTEARNILEEYVERCPKGEHPYTRWEACASLKQAYKSWPGKRRK